MKRTLNLKNPHLFLVGDNGLTYNRKKGLPSWMVKEHEGAKRKREEALKRRKDAKLNHAIISEHVDKKAEKLLATNLPFPYTSNDVYENIIRMPLGPDFNPAISVYALN